MLDANHNFVDDSTIMDNGDVNGRLPIVINFEIQVCYFTSNIKLISFQNSCNSKKKKIDLLLNIVFTGCLQY
jgi:hypothetical protein